ncbi:hypothetical protein K440DRAFT_618300 [Wilcoxina mikolae CBS 423.85]|nr:hypothetical protein K440DRAFT_618300 [Wilcoxina mikolae CBS 423.85]
MQIFDPAARFTLPVCCLLALSDLLLNSAFVRSCVRCCFYLYLIPCTGGLLDWLDGLIDGRTIILGLIRCLLMPTSVF